MILFKLFLCYYFSHLSTNKFMFCLYSMCFCLFKEFCSQSIYLWILSFHQQDLLAFLKIKKFCRNNLFQIWLSGIFCYRHSFHKESNENSAIKSLRVLYLNLLFGILLLSMNSLLTILLCFPSSFYHPHILSR